MNKKTGVITIVAIVVLALLFWIIVSRAARADESTQILYRCDGCNFSRVDWHGRNLAKARLEHDNFEGANLRGVNLRGAPAADLADAQIEGSDLRRSRLEHANLQSSSVAGTDARADNKCLEIPASALQTYGHADLSGARL